MIVEPVIIMDQTTLIKTVLFVAAPRAMRWSPCLSSLGHTGRVVTLEGGVVADE